MNESDLRSDVHYLFLTVYSSLHGFTPASGWTFPHALLIGDNWKDPTIRLNDLTTIKPS